MTNGESAIVVLVVIILVLVDSIGIFDDFYVDYDF